MIKRLEMSQLLRTFLGRNFLALSSISILFSLSGRVIAANENFPASGPLLISGDWATITGPGVILSIPGGFNLGSSDGTSTGFSVNANTHNDAIVSFLSSSNVAGTIGVTGGPVADIRGGVAGTNVIFGGQVASTLASFTDSSTMTFNTTSSAAVHFNGFNGTLVLGPGITFSGAATTTIAGTGILTLNNASTYIGAVGTPAFFINQINLPSGNARINGATVSQNIVVGQNTLTMGGALTFPAGSSFTLTASGDNTFGQILAVGQALSLTSGLTVNVNVPNTAAFSGAPLQVISGEGASGNTVLVNSLNPRYSFTALNNASDPAGHGTSNNVLLFPAIVPALPPGTTGSGAGSAFDAAVAGGTPDMLFVQGLVNGLGSSAAIAAAQMQFAPIVNGDNAFMSFQALNQFQNTWGNNLLRARAANICFDRCAPAGSPTLCDPCTESGRKNAWNGDGIWFEGFGYNADQDTRQDIAGFDAQTFGFMGAVQRPISEFWQAGIGLGYARTNISGDESTAAANHLRINTLEGTLYLGYNRGAWFLDGLFTVDWNDYTGLRSITFPGFNRIANSHYDGEGYSLLFSSGYNIYFNRSFTVTPLASIQFQKLDIDEYTESGADSLDLVQDSQNYNVIRSGLGLRAGFPITPLFNFSSILYSEIHAMWYYDIEEFRYNNTSRFQGGGPAFDTEGVRPARSEIDLGISSTIYAFANFSLQLGYDAYVRNNYLGQEANLSLSYRF